MKKLYVLGVKRFGILYAIRCSGSHDGAVFKIGFGKTSGKLKFKTRWITFNRFDFETKTIK